MNRVLLELTARQLLGRRRTALIGLILLLPLLVAVIYACDVLLFDPQHPEKLIAAALVAAASPLAWLTLRKGINVFAAATMF